MIINSYRFVSPITPFPADYGTGALIAFGLKYLSSTYTSDVVRVRRSSDSTEQDFNSTEVTNGTLTTFVGAGNDGFVTKWYNQGTGGSTYDATQATSSQQPKIVDSGSLILRNGNASIKYNGSGQKLGVGTTTNIAFTHYQKNSLFVVQQPSQSTNPDAVYWMTGTDTSISGKRSYYVRYEDRSANGYNNDMVHVIGNNDVVLINGVNPKLQDIWSSNSLSVARVYSDPTNSTASQRSKMTVNNATFLTQNTYTASPSSASAAGPLSIGASDETQTADTWIDCISAYILYDEDVYSDDADIYSDLDTMYI
jgi:hypothetical protein